MTTTAERDEKAWVGALLRILYSAQLWSFAQTAELKSGAEERDVTANSAYVPKSRAVQREVYRKEASQQPQHIFSAGFCGSATGKAS